MKRSNVIVAVLFAAALGACETGRPSGGSGAGDSGSQGSNENENSGGTQSSGITGELVFFSGRPAPEWEIPSEEFESLRERVEGLDPAEEPADFPRFGIVGYFVSNPEGKGGLPVEFLVQDGIVEVRDGETYSYYADQMELETALRMSAMNAGVYSELGLAATP